MQRSIDLQVNDAGKNEAGKGNAGVGVGVGAARLDKMPLQEVDSTTDHRTFGEIEADEAEQWARIHNHLKEHRFDTRLAAKSFQHRCIAYTYKRLGLRVEDLLADILTAGAKTRDERRAAMHDSMYRRWRIRVSYHTPAMENELWQAGTYIYKRDELVAFIGRPGRYQSERVLTLPFWLVRTNVKLPAAKGVRR